MHVSLHTPNPAPTTLAGYVKAGSLTPVAAAALEAHLRATPRRTLVISGKTGTSKTTFAAALAAAAGTARTVVTVERDPELVIHRRRAQPIACSDSSALAALLSDRQVGADPVLVVDEESRAASWALADVSAPRVTRVLIQHAGSPTGALERLRHLAPNMTVAAAVSVVVHCRRSRETGPDHGPRVVIDVHEVLGQDQGAYLLGPAQ